jgi:hopanoid C-3 methylase
VKILLIQPAKGPLTIGGEDVSLYEPLALEYLAAGAAAHHDVHILDLRLGGKLKNTLEEYQPDIVGITAYTVHVNGVRRLFREVKSWNSETLTVAGGHHATVMPQDFDSPAIDLVVIGEGVAPFREIVARREKRGDFQGIPGVAVRTSGALAEAPAAEAGELDSVSLPARELTRPYRRHYFSEWMKPLASIRTSKGCPFRCNFCAQWKIAGGRYFRRQPEAIVKELAAIEEPYVFFSDDESLVDTARMTRLAELIRQEGIRKRYFVYGRPDTIARHPELLELWRGIGLERIFVGFEFVKNADLSYVGKGSTSAESEKAAAILAGLDLEAYASFMVRPEFTREDFAAFRPYCEKLKLQFATFAVLTPLPGTDLYAQVQDRLITRNYDLFDFIHTVLPTALPLDQFYKEYHRLYTRTFPVSRQLAQILRRLPLKEVLPALSRGRRALDRIRTAHLDYQTPTPA